MHVLDLFNDKERRFLNGGPLDETTKQRLDPSCWSNKKIGNPKTKIKGGVRVNNCVPKESVEEGQLGNPGEPDSPVAQAIVRRILMQRTDLLAKHGPDKVSAAVDEVADFVGDVEEIGSSDVSGWIRHVEQMLGNMGEGVAEGVAETVSLDDALKVLRHYGATNLKTTSNELHFYKNGRPFSVDLIFNDDATRSVSLSQLNSAGRKLKGQGIDEDMSRRGFLQGLGAAALGAAGIGAAGNAQGKVTFDNNGKQINPPDWKNFQGTAPAPGAKPQSATATNAAPMTGPGSKPVRTADALQALSDTSKETAAAAQEAWRNGQKLRSNPKFREEYDRIEKFYDTTRTGLLTKNKNFSANPDLRRRQIGEMFKMLIDLDREFVEKTNALINQYGRLKEQGVAEAGFPGAPDVEMPPMQPSGDPQRDKLKQEYIDLHHEIKSLVDIQYNSTSDEEKIQAKARIKQLNDRADQIKAILEPRQPPNEWQKKTYGYDDNWNIVKKDVAEATGDKPFDDMMKTIKKGTAKQATADRREQRKQSQQQARDAFGPNPAANLGIRKPPVSEGDTEQKPRIRKYTKMRPDGSKAIRYEVLDYMGRRANGQGSEGFDDLKNAKQFYYRNRVNLVAPVDEEYHGPNGKVDIDRSVAGRTTVRRTDWPGYKLGRGSSSSMEPALYKDDKHSTAGSAYDDEENLPFDDYDDTKPIGMKESSRYWCKEEKRWKDNK